MTITEQEAAERYLAKRAGKLGTEGAFEVLSRARVLEAQGQTVIHFEIGEPDFDTAPHIVEAAIKAMHDGFTHYAPSAGLPQLREAVIQSPLGGRHVRFQFIGDRVGTLTVKGESLRTYSRFVEIPVEGQPFFEVADNEQQLMEDNVVVERTDHEPVTISGDQASSVFAAGRLPEPAPQTRNAGEQPLRLHIR